MGAEAAGAPQVDGGHPVLSIWLGRMLCPEGHCLVAAATDDASDVKLGRLELYLQRGLESAYDRGLIGMTCRACGSPRVSWRIQIEESKSKTVADALRWSNSEAGRRAEALIRRSRGQLYKVNGSR